MNESRIINEIAIKISNAGGRLYLVGGAVRDELIKREITDEDYCVVGIEKEKFEEMFPNAIIKGKKFAVYDIEGYEFALARKEVKQGTGHKNFEIETDKNITIMQDLERRDITINSIAKDILTGNIIDPFDGRKDIMQKIIRKTSSAFREDPLRVYRVARFAATLQFKVDKETIEEMKQLKEELKMLSVERVFEEFRKALSCEKPSIFFQVLKEAEVLQVHFKEIYNLIGKIQPEKYHPEGDSYNHTMQVLDLSAQLTKDLLIRYSCLVHDLGKGSTPVEMFPHHYGHEERGEKLVGEMGERLKIPKEWTKAGKIAAKEHMKGGNFCNMTPKKQVSLIERISKSKLGLDGMKIVVMCDKNRDNASFQDINFDIIGKECMKKINGKYIIEKYHLKPGEKLKMKLHEERIDWIKSKQID